METKYTKDGKKVAVLGKLNNETWIVQEIFISNGQELPCGENFTTKTLLDSPASTWESRRVESLKATMVKLEQRITEFENKSVVLRRKSSAAKLINEITEKYQDLDISELDTLFAFLSGNITHIIQEGYHDWEILSLVDALEAVDNWGSGSSFEGLKLVSLFGCREDGTRYKGDRTYNLTYRINQYSDGSGSRQKIYPCRSYKDAVAQLDSLVADAKPSEKLIQLKKKHNLTNPTQEKIKAYKKECIKNAEATVKDAEGKLNEKKKELKALQRGLKNEKPT